jgi:uncharacterized protein (TIGR02246 family)
MFPFPAAWESGPAITPEEDNMQARFMLFSASLAFAALLAGCNRTTAPAVIDNRDADATTIRQLEADWLKAYQAKDADKIASFYAEDASVINPGLPVVTGKADILSMFRKELTDKNFSVTFPPSDKVVVSKSGDMAYTQGSYTVTYTDPKTKKPMLKKGKFVEVYMKQADGNWKDVVDIGNSDGPATPMKASPMKEK